MKQYTTPLITLIHPMDITTGYDVWVYFQRRTITVEKTNKDISMELIDGEKTKIEVPLTQEETAKLARGDVGIEVTWKNRSSGYVGKTDIAIIHGCQALKKEEV